MKEAAGDHPRPSFFRFGCGRRQGNSRFRRQQQEGECFLEVEANRPVVVTQITDGYVLADMQVEIAAARRQNEGPGDRRGPDDLAVDQASDVLEDRIAVISGFAQSRIGIGTQQDGVGTIDADET
jgi:hypothetical protein